MAPPWNVLSSQSPRQRLGPRRRPPVLPGAPTEITDPRVITILSTEHWSLLTARSLVYNETFTRGGMFLTLLSASLVALGFVYQGGGGGPEFRAVVVAVLALDLFVGLATLGRILGASGEEFRALQATARIRHAYLELAPDRRALPVDRHERRSGQRARGLRHRAGERRHARSTWATA